MYLLMYTMDGRGVNPCERAEDAAVLGNFGPVFGGGGSRGCMAAAVFHVRAGSGQIWICVHVQGGGKQGSGEGCRTPVTDMCMSLWGAHMTSSGEMGGLGGQGGVKGTCFDAGRGCRWVRRGALVLCRTKCVRYDYGLSELLSEL